MGSLIEFQMQRTTQDEVGRYGDDDGEDQHEMKVYDAKTAGLEMERIFNSHDMATIVNEPTYFEPFQTLFIAWLRKHEDLADYDITDSEERTPMDYAAHFEMHRVDKYLYEVQFRELVPKTEADEKFHVDISMDDMTLTDGTDGMDFETKYEGGIAEFRSLLVNYISNAIIDNGCLAKFNQ
jgi:hypothetical protein